MSNTIKESNRIKFIRRLTQCAKEIRKRIGEDSGLKKRIIKGIIDRTDKSISLALKFKQVTSNGDVKKSSIFVVKARLKINHYIIELLVLTHHVLVWLIRLFKDINQALTTTERR